MNDTFKQLVESVPDTMCLYPFTHVNFKFGGKASCCFRSKPLLNETGGEMWNSTAFRDLRLQLAQGKKSSVCENCWKLEEQGGFSYRQESIRDKVVHTKWRPVMNDFDQETGEMRTGPRQVEVRLSNLCGMTCRMCSPEYSSKWNQLVEKNESLRKYHKPALTNPDHEKDILNFLDQHKATLEYVMFSGGEPLLQRAHYKSLQLLSPYEERITLEYTTNLNSLRDEHEGVLDYWPKFRRVRVKISLDSDRELYPFLRLGGNIDKLEENLKILQKRFPSQQRLDPINNFPDDDVIFIGTCTVSVYNVARLAETVRFFTKLGLVFHTSQVQRPFHLNTRVLPAGIKRGVTEKLNAFLLNLDQELADCWEEQDIWQNHRARETQKYRIHRFVQNSITFMNAEDCSQSYKSFIEFDRKLQSAAGSKGIFDFYPEWQAYV